MPKIGGCEGHHVFVILHMSGYIGCACSQSQAKPVRETRFSNLNRKTNQGTDLL